MWQLGQGGVLFGTLEPRFPLVTHLLEDAGYYVGYVGKPWAPGDWQAGGLSRHPNGIEFAAQREVNPPVGINVHDYAANFADFLAHRPANAPFFFWYGCTEPHREYEPGIGLRSGKRLSDVQVPPFLPDTPEVRGELLDYYYEIEHFDQHLGRMLDTLEQAGELANTVVVVTSDNGMPFSHSKGTLYDSGVRMPTAMCWGDAVPAGRTIDDFIGHIDLAPTFLDAAGVPKPEAMTGSSLLSVLTSQQEGRIDSVRARVITGIERHTYCRPEGETYPIRALRNYEYLYVRNFAPDRWPTGGPEFISSNKAPHGDIDDGPFKDFMLLDTTRVKFPVIFEMGFGKRPLEELYELAHDPHQLHNLADDPKYAHIKSELWRQLRSYLIQSGDPRVRGQDPWQSMIYRQVDGFGATFNMSLPQSERAAARSRQKHAVSPGAKE